MSHNTTTGICFIAYLIFMAYLCFLFQNAWPLLLMLGMGGFKTDKEIEAAKTEQKDA